MRKIRVFLAAVLALLSSPHPQASAAAQPEGAPVLSPADLSAWLDGFMPFAIGTGDIAGAAVAVVKDGEIIALKGYGFADVASGRKVDPAATIFRNASVSKLFTWTAVMQQVERGKLDLDADVQTYLDFSLPVRADGPITLRHIMTHRSGFDEMGRLMYADDGASMVSLAQFVRNPPPRIRKAGTVSAYSNYATALAGYIVQRVAGIDFATYVEREITAPLGMTHTTFRQPLPAKLQPDLATAYEGTRSPRPFEYLASTPAGGLSSSVRDMAQFMLAHLQLGRLGEAQILKPDSAQLMQTAQVAPVPGLPPMGLGFIGRARNGVTIWSHAGDIHGMHADLNLLPAHKIGLYVALNGGALGAAVLRTQLLEGFVDRYFPQKLPPIVKQPTALEHGRLMAGRWESSRDGETSFLALAGLLGQRSIKVEADGTLVTGSIMALNRQPKRWQEIAPFVWREENGPNRLVAKVENGRPVRFSADDSLPVFEYWPVPAWKSKGWILPALGLSLLACGATAIAGLARAVRRVPAIPGRRIAAGVASLLLLFFGGWAWIVTTVLGSAPAMDGRLDPWIRLLEVLLLVAVAGAGALAVDLARTRPGRAALVTRAAIVAASLFVAWFAVTFSLAPLHLTY